MRTATREHTLPVRRRPAGKQAGVEMIQCTCIQVRRALFGCFILEDIVYLLVQDLVFAHLFQFPPCQRPAHGTQRGFTLAAFLAWLPFQYNVMCDCTHRLAPFPLP